MGWFLNLKTGQKLALAFGLCLALATLVGGVAISRMGQMNGTTQLINSDSVAGLKCVAQLTNDSKLFRILQFEHVLETDDNKMRQLESQMADFRGQVNQDITDYQATTNEADDKANIAELKNRWDAYLSYYDQVVDFSHKNDFKHASQILNGPASDAFKKVSDQVDTITIWNSKHAEKLVGVASGTYNSAKITVVILLSLAIALGIGLAIMVTKMIVSRLKEVSESLNGLTSINLTNLGTAVDALAVGDLSATVVTNVKPLAVDTREEFGALATTVNAMIHRTDVTIGSFVKAQESLRVMAGAADEVANGNLTVAVKPQSDKDVLGNAVDKMVKNLSKLIAQTRHAAENIGNSAEEVSAGNRDLSQRTEEQASSLEETAASMEEMTSTVKQNADNSRQANQLAAHARELAEKGGTVVGEAVSAMGEINQGSKKIAEIISVIDEIAFQTNLLALNASVEAARVGEQGRGFAVVAAEVRNLAGRSATAAKEIKSLVGDTVQKVQDGSDLVNQSGNQLGEIVGAVKKVADIIAEISAASIEQSAGIEQVNRAVMQMDQMTQQNAALVEEAAATSASMAHLANDLQALVGTFKLDASYAVPVAAPVAQRAAATGTYGGGRPSIKSRNGVTKQSTKLQMVSHGPEAPASTQPMDEEFGEF